MFVGLSGPSEKRATELGTGTTQRAGQVGVDGHRTRDNGAHAGAAQKLAKHWHGLGGRCGAGDGTAPAKLGVGRPLQSAPLRLGAWSGVSRGGPPGSMGTPCSSDGGRVLQFPRGAGRRAFGGRDRTRLGVPALGPACRLSRLPLVCLLRRGKRLVQRLLAGSGPPPASASPRASAPCAAGVPSWACAGALASPWQASVQCVLAVLGPPRRLPQWASAPCVSGVLSWVCAGALASPWQALVPRLLAGSGPPLRPHSRGPVPLVCLACRPRSAPDRRT